MNQQLIYSIEQSVKQSLSGGESGHDWTHIQRVRTLALNLAQKEINQNQLSVNIDIVELGALLHDIADWKFHNGDIEAGPKKAKELLEYFNYPNIDEVLYIIKTVSYKGAKVDTKPDTIEAQIVQDADRIDALGAIGIARCFSYGGYRQRVMYDPNIQPILHQSFQEYQQNQSTTINHFYEKLLLLKDRMNTESGKQIALQRHNFMLNFLDQFYNEWNGLV